MNTTIPARRKHIRYRDYDYSNPGAYFVTICTRKMKCVFGNISNEKMILSHIGKIAERIWCEIPNHFQNVNLDEYVIMPNHIHGIIIILNEEKNIPLTDGKGDACIAPTVNKCGPKPKSLGAIVGTFKSAVTKRVNEIHGKPGKTIWQRNYYDRIIRNEKEYHRIQEYIVNNPRYWDWDKINPDKLENVKPNSSVIVEKYE